MIAGVAAFLLLVATQGPVPVRAPLVPVHTPYLDIVWRFLDGDDDGAVADLSLMSVDGLDQRLFDDLERATTRIAGAGRDDVRGLGSEQRFLLARTWATLAHAAAALHLETARYLMEKGRVKEGVEHFGIARHLVDWARWPFIHATLRSAAHDEAHTRIRRGVYLATAYLLQNHLELTALKDHLKRARDVFPHDAEVLLASGSAEEMGSDRTIVRQMSPLMDGRMLERWRDTVRSSGLEHAEEFHREAIKVQPTLAEAHMRLGRVLYLRHKLPEARKALETARDLEPVNEIGYLTALFLARVTEDEGNDVDAFAQYTEMVSVWPECHAPHVALSRMFEARGDRQAALGALLPLFRDPVFRKCQYDPWWIYLYGQVWRIMPLLDALRTEVRS